MKRKFKIEYLNMFIAGGCANVSLLALASGDVGNALLGIIIAVANILLAVFYGGL